MQQVPKDLSVQTKEEREELERWYADYLRQRQEWEQYEWDEEHEQYETPSDADPGL